MAWASDTRPPPIDSIDIHPYKNIQNWEEPHGQKMAVGVALI